MQKKFQYYNHGSVDVTRNMTTRQKQQQQQLNQSRAEAAQ